MSNNERSLKYSFQDKYSAVVKGCCENIMTLFLLLIALFFLTACQEKETTQKEPKAKEEKRMISKPLPPLDRDSTEYREFMKQKNRFVLNPCGISYNEKPLTFDMSIEEVREVLWVESFSHIPIFSKNSRIYYWEGKGIKIVIVNNKYVTYMDVFLKKITYNKRLNTKVIGNQSFIIFNTTLEQKDKMHNFLEKSTFSFNDFRYGPMTGGYSIKYTCNNKTFKFYFNSKVPYINKYGSIGHLTPVGNFSPKDSHVVTEIEISRDDR